MPIQDQDSMLRNSTKRLLIEILSDRTPESLTRKELGSELSLEKGGFQHRENALNTFETFVNAASDDVQTKNAVLLQATQCIFSPQPTGYSNKGVEADSTPKIIEIVKVYQKWANRAAQSPSIHSNAPLKPLAPRGVVYPIYREIHLICYKRHFK